MEAERAKVAIRGAVQGVGFRPFVYRLALELKLNGWVLNSTQGVFIEVEGLRESLQTFLLRLEKEKPARAIIQSLESSFLDAAGYDRFEIRETEDRGEKTALILPDIATCADCLREILDSNDRRFGYPFTNCTNCGPRFSIIEALPYDRANTAMKKFTMCAECEREYHDPLDRRFHAQPNACAVCGPHLEFRDENGREIATENEALLRAAAEIKNGKIVALKGIGGFQLVVDARSEEAVVRLRERKQREEKPFALMFPSLEFIRECCEVSDPQARLLQSPEAPIVLVGRAGSSRRRNSTDGPSVHPYHLAESTAPNNPNLGAMLPYTPLHHLLMHELDFPVVATSGNLSDEPICIDEFEALQRLRGIADFFLVHDRPIVRHMDDSIVRIMYGRELVLRRARGYAPLPITVKSEIRNPKSEMILAVGAHLKNTIALSVGENIFISQHIGDLETEQSYRAFKNAAADLPRLYDVQPEIIACDMHPDYLSTKFALEMGSAGFQPLPTGILPGGSGEATSQQDAAKSEQDAGAPQSILRIQHHWAHVAACMAENEIEPLVLGVSWDGTGFGLDGTIWGGEFLLAKKVGQVCNLPARTESKRDACPTLFSRVAHFRQFALPGGEAAMKEPRRSALGVGHEIFERELWNQREFVGDFSKSEIAVMRQILEKKINAPITSSVGRLFDAVASLVGLRQRTKFEGQAAMELEFAIQPGIRTAYPFELKGESPVVIDWQPTILAIISDLKRDENMGAISAKFHNMLAETIVAVARKVGERKVVLSGGCFQNKYLTERAIERLREEDFRPYWHQRIPPNDGGIALGQVVIAAWAQKS